jgi:hypothetical protein
MSPDHKYRCTCGSAECAGKVFKSVTTILGKAVPKDLSWWGMQIGAAGAHVLTTRGYDFTKLKPTDVVAALQTEKLTVRDQLTAGGIRGTAVHEALEAYATKGTIPLAATFPEQDRGYVRGLAKFFTTYEPEFVATEVRVLSLAHEFAGTYDFLAFVKARLVSIKRPRARKERLFLVPDADARLLIRGDLKTSKWVYPASHFAQLEAYEGADVEMGGKPSDVRAVLHVTRAGGMELVPATAVDGEGNVRLACFADFLALKASADAISAMESSYARPR